MTVPAYPLQWPEGWKRTSPAARDRARFGSTREVKSSFSDSTWRQKGQITIAEAVSRIRGARKVECARCGRQWGMHDGTRSFVPWDDDLERLYSPGGPFNPLPPNNQVQRAP